MIQELFGMEKILPKLLFQQVPHLHIRIIIILWIIDHPSFERFREPLIYDYLEFTFNGTVFLGDYKKFKEIKEIY